MREDQENLSPPTKKDNEKLPETPVSGDRKLTIKLKIANLEKRIEEDRISPQENFQSKVCTVCNKEFSSGKALGGHIKVHLHDDNNKQQSLKKLKTHHKKPIKFKIQNPQWVVDFYKKRDSNEATNESLVGNGKQIVCLLCEKKFSSMKALFGHMRSHPERERRGIEPSLAAKNSPSSSVSESVPRKIDDHIDTDVTTMGNPVTDLMESLPRWPVTARRNPRVVVATLEYSSSEEEVETKLFYGAVDELIRLAHGNSFNSSLTYNDRIEEYEATNHSSLTNKAEIGNKHRVFESNKPRIEASPVKYREDYHVKKQRIEERGLSNDGGHIGVVPKNMDKGKEKAMLESDNSEWVDAKDWNRQVEDYMNCTDDESDIKDTEDLCRVQLMNYKCERTSPRSVMISSKKIKTRKRNEVDLRDLEVVSDGNLGDYQTKKPIVTRTPNKYQCSTCDRCYSTKQALGGHMSYHKRDKNFQNTIDKSSSEDKHHPNPIFGVGEKFVESTHQCEFCNRTFLTGQALGGHKRYCHLSTSPVAAPSSRAASPGKASQTVCRILGFDLNEPPPMEDEEC